MTFDLGDPVCWEFMLLSTVKPVLLIPDMEEEDDEEEQENGDQVSAEVVMEDYGAACYTDIHILYMCHILSVLLGDNEAASQG